MIDFMNQYWLVLVPTCWVVAISINRFIEWYRESKTNHNQNLGGSEKK